jgi:type II secretory pathway component PulF
MPIQARHVATYAYNAINAQGLELAGTLAAPDRGAAVEQLRLKGLLAQRLDEVTGGATARVESPAGGLFRKVRPCRSSRASSRR